VFSKSKIFKFLKRDCGTIPVAEIINGKIEIFSKHQRFLIATDSSKYLLIFVQRDQQGLKLLAANDSKIFPKYEIFFVRQCWHPLQVVNVKKFRLCYELVVLKHDTYKTTKNSIKCN
jgi:flagellar assembly factor FliW